MIAAYGAGWFLLLKKQQMTMSGKTKLIKPNLSNKKKYDELINIYQNVYSSNKNINKQLVKFSSD